MANLTFDLYDEIVSSEVLSDQFAMQMQEVNNVIQRLSVGLSTKTTKINIWPPFKLIWPLQNLCLKIGLNKINFAP